MAINDMILPGVKNPLLAVAEEIRKQISTKALEQPKTSPPTAGAPEERDYTEGMERPELTTLKGEREFKATPAKTSAFLVALGNILQDKQNLEAAKQQAQQGEYNAKLSDAMELNKLFKTNKMKREFDESDPDTLMKREAFQKEQAHKEKMYPLEEKRAQAYIDKLLKPSDRVGSNTGVSGETTGETYLDQQLEASAWDYAQQFNVPIEDAREAVGRDALAKTGKDPSRRQAIANYIKRNTYDPMKEALQEVRQQIYEEKLKALKNPDPTKQAEQLQRIAAREANIRAMEQDYGPSVSVDVEETIKKYSPKTQKEKKIINGITYEKAEGGWKKVK